MGFMRLDILTELVLAVMIMVNSLTCHNSAWTECCRYTVSCGKSIQPKYFTIGQLKDHARRDVHKRDGIITAAHTFLDSADVAFDVSDVLIASGGIEMNAHTEQVAFHALESTVREGMSQAETAPIVDPGDIAYGGDKGRLILIGQSFDGAELNVSGDGDKERKTIHMHDVSTERDHLITFMYSRW